MTQRKTILEIARRVGVTDGTVSRALRGSQRVKESTRNKVIQVAREMGYRSHAGGRFLSTGKTFTFGLICPSLRYPLNAEICECLQQALGEIGYGLIVTSQDNRDEEAVGRMRILSEHCVDGIILQPAMSQKDVPCFDACKQFNIPLVVSSDIPDRQLPFVSFDNYRGMYMMTKHILEQGYKRPAFLTSWPSLSGNQHLIDGFRQALRDFDVNPAECRIYSQDDDFTNETLPALLDSLFSSQNPADAVILCDVTTATRTYHILRDKGLRLGEEVALASLDEAPWLDDTVLPVTTLHYSIPDLARRLIDSLMRQIDGKSEMVAGEYILPALRPRKTTGRKING